MLFSKIIGHQEIKDKLIATVLDNRVSHALMFHGPEGSGNMAMAIAFAQYLNCNDRSMHDSCGQCPTCHKFEKLAHPDLHFIYPVASTSEVDEKPRSIDFIKYWREFCPSHDYYFTLNEWHEAIGIEKKQSIISVHDAAEIMKTLSYKSYEGSYKVMIIWMPEKMNQQAANKILKVLEEPPEMTLFALVSENLDPILPTILSRTQLIRIPKIADEDLLSAFSNTEGKSREEILTAVRMSEGNFVAARTFLSGNGEEHVFFTLFRDWMRDCYRFDGDAQADPEALAKIFRFADEMGRESREYQKSFLSYALHCIRDTYIYNYIPQNVVREQAETDFITKFRNTITPENCLMVAEVLGNAIYHVERNAHSGILFQDLGIRLSGAFTRLKR